MTQDDICKVVENHAEGKDVIVVSEVKALLHYASEIGLDPENKVVGGLYTALRIYESDPSPNYKKDSIDPATDVLIKYSMLSGLVNKDISAKNRNHAINGRTLLETHAKCKKQSRRLLFWTFFFIICSFTTEAIDLWLLNADPPERGMLLIIAQVHLYFLDNFSPFFWGALGSCVFLLKGLSDRIAERCFDSRRWRGWGTRIMLGAILGTIVVSIYDPTSFNGKNVNLDSNAIAFLTGLGVKVVYGVLEKLIETLSDKFNLDSKGS